MTDNYVTQWDDSYTRGENFLIYPNEEVIRFCSRRIARYSPNGVVEYFGEFNNGSRVLDFGCGAGRHLKLLNDLGLLAFGTDISEKALSLAEQNFLTNDKIGSDRRVELSLVMDKTISYPDNYFDAAISCSVFDSMHFSTAQTLIEELARVLKPGAYCFIDLIAAYDNRLPDGFNGEVIVDTTHEFGTVQSYYDLNKIKSLCEPNFTIEDCYLVRHTSLNGGKMNAARTYLELRNTH